jgi:hypothetical protein
MHPSRNFQGNSHVLENWSRLFAQTPDLKAGILRFSSQEGLSWSEWEMQGTSVEGRRTLIRGVVICTFQVTGGARPGLPWWHPR